MKIECGADANEHRRAETIVVVAHPALLLWRAQADPDDIGFRIIDEGTDCLVLLGGYISIWRAELAGDLVIGKLTREFVREGVRDSRCAAVKKMAVTGGGCFPPKAKHQLWAVHAAGQREAAPAAEPDQRHAIGNDQACRCERGAKLRVVFGFGDAVHSGDGDVAAGVAARDPILHLGDDVRNLHGVNARPEDKVFASGRICLRHAANGEGAHFDGAHCEDSLVRWASILKLRRRRR